MAKVQLSDGSEPLSAFPLIRGVTFTGAGGSQTQITPGTVVLSLWRHTLQPGAVVAIAGPAEDHLFLVESGGVQVRDRTLGARCMVSVGRGGAAELKAGPAGAVLRHMMGSAATRPDKPGGCVHIVGETGLTERIHESYHQTVYAVPTCPNCSLWAHRYELPPGQLNPRHHHTEDEIISLLDGEMQFGSRTLKPGMAVAIAANASYSFTSGPEGLSFFNFRQAPAEVVFFRKPAFMD